MRKVIAGVNRLDARTRRELAREGKIARELEAYVHLNYPNLSERERDDKVWHLFKHLLIRSRKERRGEQDADLLVVRDFLGKNGILV